MEILLRAHDRRGGGAGRGGKNDVVGREEWLRGRDAGEMGVEGREKGGESMVGGVGWGSDDEDGVEGGEDAEVCVGGRCRFGGDGEARALEDGEGGGEVAGSLIDDTVEVLD